MASYPTSVKSFTTKNTADTVQAAHINDLQDEVNAIEDGLRNATAPLASSNSTMANLSVSGGSTLGGLTVSSVTTLGRLTVTGGSTLATLSVSGASTLFNTDFSSVYVRLNSSPLSTGNVSGPRLECGYLTAGNGAAGTLLLYDRAGGPHYLWVDTAGTVRINTGPPTEDNTVSDTAGTVIGTQT